MIKAIAIRTPKGGKSEILATGRVGDCLDVARAAGLEIKNIGDAVVQVFSYTGEGAIFNDDGRKADYQRRLAEAEAKAQDAKEPAPKSEEPKPAPAKKATKRRGRPPKAKPAENDT